MSDRMAVLTAASFSGACVSAMGALFVAGMWLTAFVALVLGTVALLLADYRMPGKKQYARAVDSAPGSGDLWVDPFGPFGWMRNS